MPPALSLAATVHDELLRRCRAAAPREFVALLGGARDGATWHVRTLRPLANTAVAADRFDVAPAAFAVAEAELRAHGAAWLGFVHSHPAGPALPSQHDRAALWRDCVQGIVAPVAGDWRLRMFWLERDACHELAVAIAPAPSAAAAERA